MTAVCLCFLLLLCGCVKAEELGSLTEFSHPYAGEYECTRLLVGGEDRLNSFECVRLTLTGGGDFLLSYRAKTGERGEYGGKYRVDEGGKYITFSAAAGPFMRERAFPMQEGVISIEVQLGRKLLFAQFQMP